MTDLRIFVYGTLKPEECNHSYYCGDRVRQKIPAYTYGQLYHLTLGYPAMTVGEGKVKGYLLIFTDETVLENLDRLEDYQALRPLEENEYIRQTIPVYTLPGESLGQGWGYLMTLENVRRYQGKLIESGWWTGNIS